MTYTRLTIARVNVSQCIEFKNELIAAGLVMGQDFEWAYVPPVLKDDWSGDISTPASVHFDMIDPVLATFYRLKWTSDN